MKNKNYIGLIGRHLSGNINAEDKAELMAWVEADDANRKFFDEMARLWGISAEYEEEPLEVDTAAAWAALESRLEEEPGKQNEQPPSGSGRGEGKIVRIGPLRRLLQYAAAALLLLAGGYWLFFSAGEQTAPMVSIQTAAGERQEISLPDGSMIALNENSELAYPADFTERRVLLTGEAFFEVTKLNGKPFTIEAEGTATTVLGTAFNVRAYPGEEEVAVSVQSGKVALQKASDEQKKVLLEAGEAGVYHKQEETVEEVPISNAASWKTQRLEFDKIKMAYVVEALERHFKVDVELANPELLNCTFIGSYPDPKLEDILAAFTFTMDMKVSREGNTIVIDGDASNCR